MRKLPILLASLMLLSCTACGDSDDDSKSGKSTSGNQISDDSAVLDGKYVQLYPLNGDVSVYLEDIDKGLEYAIESYANRGPHKLEFSGGNFSVSGQLVTKDYPVYSGTYTMSDGKIIFNYTDYSWEGTTVNINEDIPEPDMDIVRYQQNAEAIKGLPKDEQIARCNAEQLLLSKKNIQNALVKFNETGTYWDNVAPALVLDLYDETVTFDKSTQYRVYSFLPLFVYNAEGRRLSIKSVFTLYPVNDFICVPTYGFKLNGNYNKGDDFTVTFNILDTLKDDKYSLWYTQDWENHKESNGQTTAEKYMDIFKEQYGNLDDTTLKFSNGKWEWKNSEGKLINNGTYLESEEHEGLIAMCLNDKSKNIGHHPARYSPYFFYIDSAGTIWYPNWVKMD